MSAADPQENPFQSFLTKDDGSVVCTLCWSEAEPVPESIVQNEDTGTWHMELRCKCPEPLPS